jgi:photosystem II stability/assembly factor-like uncharacterized protein
MDRTEFPRASRRPRRTATVLVNVVSTLVVMALSQMPTSTSGASASSDMNPILLVRAGLSDVDYVLWSTPCNASTCYRLERLSDGGQIGHFVTAPPITSVSGSSGNLNELVFANTQDGYAVDSSSRGSQLYATLNGGVSWRKAQIRPDQVIDWMAWTSTNFYAVTSKTCAPSQKACNSFALDRSAAASIVWSAMPVPIGPTHATQPPEVTAFGSDVWLTGQQQEEPGKALLASSRLYGQGFNVTSVPELMSVNGCALEAMSTTDLWAQCDEGMMAGTVPYSDDGGAHWIVKENGLLGQFHFGVFDPVSDAVAFFVGSRNMNVLYQVTNGAATIKVVGRSPDSATPGLSALAFTNFNQGLALSGVLGNSQRRYLYRTENGGRNWTRVLG